VTKARRQDQKSTQRRRVARTQRRKKQRGKSKAQRPNQRRKGSGKKIVLYVRFFAVEEKVFSSLRLGVSAPLRYVFSGKRIGGAERVSSARIYRWRMF
jgi:hypothetical protein